MKAKAPRAMKKHLVGFETELLLLDGNGAVSNAADLIIKKSHEAKLKYPVHKECTHNAVEISSVANVKVRKGTHAWLETIEKLVEIGKKEGVRIYPYGTYTGTFRPAGRTDKDYRMQEDIIGRKKFWYNAGHVTGFHIHYCLPYGTFNRRTNSLNNVFRSKYKDHLLNLYNMLIAMDPAVTNFMESSPFVDGNYVAKDSRVFLYRTMHVGRGKDEISGLYSDLPIFGELPPYATTLSDLIALISKRYRTWHEIIESRHPKYKDTTESKHPLQFYWGPVRINRVGTFEYRGMDMNLPTHMIGTSLLVKYVLKMIRRDNLRVKPSEIGIKEPFKIEGGVLYVPPFSYVDEVLQPKSALYGLDDRETYRYSKALLNLGLKAVPSKKDPGLAKIMEIIEKKKTKSDEIIDYVKRRGYSLSDRLDEGFARALALKAARDFEDEVRKLRSRELAIDFEE